MSFVDEDADLPPAFSPRDPAPASFFHVNNHQLMPPPAHEHEANTNSHHSDPAPSYDLPFDELYLQFKSADEAAAQSLAQPFSYVENHTKLHAKLTKASKDLVRLKKIK